MVFIPEEGLETRVQVHQSERLSWAPCTYGNSSQDELRDLRAYIKDKPTASMWSQKPITLISYFIP